jgi:hypothetical protein
MPNKKPRMKIAKASQIAPNLEPTICSKAAASEERRALIALELFSGLSKYATS